MSQLQPAKSSTTIEYEFPVRPLYTYRIAGEKWHTRVNSITIRLTEIDEAPGYYMETGVRGDAELVTKAGNHVGMVYGLGNYFYDAELSTMVEQARAMAVGAWENRPR